MSRMTIFAQTRSMRCHCLLPCYRRSRKQKSSHLSKISLYRLRTSLFTSDHADYHGIYCGSLPKRDAAYHQGTAWGFLLGGFLSAYAKSPRPFAGMHQRAAFPARAGASSSDRQWLYRLDLRNFRRGCTSQSKRMLCAGMERR